MGREIGRRVVMAGAVALAWPLRAGAEPPPTSATAPAPAAPPPTLDDLVSLDLQEDAQRRMRTQVRVNGRGPFPFLIDTGADHSALSQEFAAALDLPAAGHVAVHGVAGTSVRSSAGVRSLEVGGRELTDQSLALLNREDLGALGLIGLDVLHHQRVDIDFNRRVMEVRRSRGFPEDAGAVVVRGRSRFGQLMLVDSSIRGTRIFVVLDTGSEATVGNPALRAWLYARRKAHGEADPRQPVKLTSVTGQTVMGEADEMPELTLATLTLRHVPVVYAELETFRLFGLLHEPALMLGMDVLRSFARVSVDFGRREVGFTLQAA